MYQHLHNNPKSKITLEQRRKFIKAMADFQLMDQLAQRLAQSLASDSNMGTNNNTNAGEDICETILTILEVVEYPPEDPPQFGQQQQQQQAKTKTKEDVMVGEDALFAPLASPDWWKSLLETTQRPDCTFEQREAIARITVLPWGPETRQEYANPVLQLQMPKKRHRKRLLRKTKKLSPVDWWNGG
jgi:hypothetical protein